MDWLRKIYWMMSAMEPTQIALAASVLLCSLVAGLVFAFAVVVMPGIKTLDDREFLKAFQVMDRVIQNNQPIFLFVWLGSAVSVIILAMLGIWQLEGVNRVLAIVSSAVYLLGVQLPTSTVNIPLNNKLQSLDLDAMTQAGIRQARQEFEPRWNLWNSIRTVVASFATLGLILLALRL
jgi:uncharacterized membrane protein